MGEEDRLSRHHTCDSFSQLVGATITHNSDGATRTADRVPGGSTDRRYFGGGHSFLRPQDVDRPW
jgi:hypothetical protein